MANTPSTFVSRLRANVDDWYADRTTFEVFGERQGQTWREVKAAGQPVEEEVLRILRESPRPTCQISAPSSV